MKCRRLILGLALPAMLALICSAPARADEDGADYEQKSAYGPIQKRVYEMNHELSIGWSYLPIDPYYKGYGASLGYTIHFNELWALELFRVGFTWNVDSDLKTKLIDQMPDISPTEFPAVVFFENTNLILKVLYGKQSLVNRLVLHFELYTTAGASFAFRNPFNVDQLDMENARYDFGANFGVGFRFWLDPTWSVKVDIRDTVLFLGLNRGDFPLDNVAEVGLSLSVNM